jgi:hypothetical protein
MLKHVLPAIGLVSLLSLIGTHASAQKDPTTQRDAKNEIGLLAGATLTPSVSTTLPDAPGASAGSISFNASFALGIDYDYRLRDTGHGSLEAGIDFLASPNDVITSGGPGNAINQYAYIFLVPELRFEARPIGPVRPFGSVGGGYARFREGKLRNGAVNTLPGTNTAAGEFTVGVDSSKEIHLKLPILGSVPIGGRLEVRDYLSGQPNYQVPTISGTQNSVAFLGGFTIKL